VQSISCAVSKFFVCYQSRHNKKLISTWSIDITPGADEIRKLAALVRQVFKIDPYGLSDDEFAQYVSEAVWLKQNDSDMIELALMKVMSKIFGKK
jgi:hypothetical protein